MRFSKMMIPTRREDPADAEVASHRLLIRGGYIRQLARGIYNLLPLGWKSARKIEQIVREEMDAAGAQEVLMPAVQPAELWKESGRWTEYGPELLRFKDRKQSDFCLGPTHEEVITDMVRGEITSYKQLPINLYQFQAKFRDEIRPRFGLMRGREFIMKDGYSFDLDEEGALKSYDIMFEAYGKICSRLGFEFRAVEADTGNIGGSRSHEFQVLAETGEDELVSCTNCDYAANVEKAETKREALDGARDESAFNDRERVDTPGASSIEEISAFLKVEPTQTVKTLIFMLDDKTPIAVLVRGDRAANELKLKSFLNSRETEFTDLRMASDAEIVEHTGSVVGFAGPVDLKMDIFADFEVEPMVNFVVGANEKDVHFTNVNHGRDFDATAFADLRLAQSGDHCARCGGTFESYRGIEVGHVFYLGTKYSESMNATVLNPNGKAIPMEMGCYGIGITRMLAAVVEQNHDDDGIIWPMAIAPFQVIVQALQLKDDDVVEAAEKIYTELKSAGIEVLIDDRDASPGAKFKDADLIGIPIRVTVGSRTLKEGAVEYKKRGESDRENVPVDDIVDRVITDVREALS